MIKEYRLKNNLTQEELAENLILVGVICNV